jgi:hypothetical protein
MACLYGRAGRLTAKTAGSRPGQTLSRQEVRCYLELLSHKDYKQEDPLDPRFPKRHPQPGETPAAYFSLAEFFQWAPDKPGLTKEYRKLVQKHALTTVWARP